MFLFQPGPLARRSCGAQVLMRKEWWHFPQVYAPPSCSFTNTGQQAPWRNTSPWDTRWLLVLLREKVASIFRSWGGSWQGLQQSIPNFASCWQKSQGQLELTLWKCHLLAAWDFPEFQSRKKERGVRKLLKIYKINLEQGGKCVSLRSRTLYSREGSVNAYYFNKDFFCCEQEKQMFKRRTGSGCDKWKDFWLNSWAVLPASNSFSCRLDQNIILWFNQHAF